VSTTYPTSSEEERETAIEAAAQAIQSGGLVVLPTDTVYGIGADAFDHAAVQALLDAKGRGREMPPPVLVSAATTLAALASNVQPYVEALTEAFWPGPLTLVCDQQPSLTWDLGDTRGTVAVRMPDHEIALALLERTGPLTPPRACSARASRSCSTGGRPRRARPPRSSTCDSPSHGCSGSAPCRPLPSTR
jgi:L-threonylcarbamoyladenylate synthase